MQLPCRRLRRPAACLVRQWPLAFCSASMASWLRRPSPHDRDASLVPATASIAMTASASIKDFCCVPSRPANVPNVSRGRRLPCVWMSLPPVFVNDLTHPVDSPPSSQKSAWRIRAQCRCISPATPECRNIPEAAPGRRLPQAMVAAPAPDSRRLSGLPVWSRWLPTGHHRATPRCPRQ